MAFVLVALGSVLIYLEYLGTTNIKAAGSLVKDEVWGSNDPYWKWLGAIIIIMMIGYVPGLENVATMMLVLVFVSIILAQQSGFTQLLKDL